MDAQEDTSLDASISHHRVLEQEYAYRHLSPGRVSQLFSPWDVLETDVQDRDGLLRELRDPGNPISRHLRLFRELPVGNSTLELALYLTELVGIGTSLYEATAFAAVALRDTTRELVKGTRRERWFQFFHTRRLDDSTREGNVLRLNRQLLEDAFPGQIRHFDACNWNSILRLIHEERPTALCFSGGGIRSASFSLGVLQGLARGRLLSRFDYLSTVSGGGYIGSWLSGWVKRHPEGLDGVEKELSASAGASASVGSPTRSPTVTTNAIGHLRIILQLPDSAVRPALRRYLDARRHFFAQPGNPLGNLSAFPGGCSRFAPHLCLSRPLASSAPSSDWTAFKPPGISVVTRSPALPVFVLRVLGIVLCPNTSTECQTQVVFEPRRFSEARNPSFAGSRHQFDHILVLEPAIPESDRKCLHRAEVHLEPFWDQCYLRVHTSVGAQGPVVSLFPAGGLSRRNCQHRGWIYPL